MFSTSCLQKKQNAPSESRSHGMLSLGPNWLIRLKSNLNMQFTNYNPGQKSWEK